MICGASVVVAGLVGLLGDDVGGGNLVLDPGQAALAEVVVLIEHADLLAGEVLLEVLAEDLALDRVVRLPAERVIGWLVPLSQQGQPEATNMSGTFSAFRNPTTLVWVGVPRPSKIPNTLFCSTSWCTTLTVLVGL